MKPGASWFWFLVVVLGGCLPLTAVPSTPSWAVGQTREAQLARNRARSLHERALERPANAAAWLHAGHAAVRAALVGALDQQERAEEDLLTAFRRSAPGTPIHTDAARTLGRFLNMRGSVLDLSRVDLQVELYDAIVPPASEATPHAFTVRSFHSAARALQAYARDRPLTALSRVKSLERDVARRTREHPTELDSYAVASSYALTFAGVIPVGRGRRLADAIQYLEAQHTRWEGLSPRARDESIAPNTRTVSAFSLAEVSAAAADLDRARRYYGLVIDLDAEPDTPVRRRVVAVARHRLERLDAYLGRPELLPLWPGGQSSCVSCHSRESDLPMAGLYTLEGGAG